MYLDEQLKFADAQALTATGVSTNVINFGFKGVGSGEPMSVIFVVDVAPDATTGNETYILDIQNSSDEAFTTPFSYGNFTLAGVPAGFTVALPIFPNAAISEPYYRLNLTLGGTTPSITYTAFVIPSSMVDTYYSYADRITIS